MCVSSKQWKQVVLVNPVASQNDSQICFSLKKSVDKICDADTRAITSQ